jgi:hypothetical protein
MLDSPGVVIRYWGIVGCFLLDDQNAGLQCIDDDSHEVRAMAAWLLVREVFRGQAVEVFELGLPASLSHPNIITIHDAGIDQDGRLFFTMDLKGDIVATHGSIQCAILPPSDKH